MPPSKIQQTLARNRLGVPAILAIIIAAAAPMSVIFGGAAAAFATSELVALPLACIAIAVLLAFWAPGYLAMGRDIANAGSTYSYISRGLGRVPGAAAGGIALVGYNMMQCAFYGGFGLAASQLTSAVGVDTPWWAWAVPAWLVVGLLGLGKVDISSRVLIVLLLGELALVAIFTLVFLAEPGPAGVDATALDPSQLGQASTLVALGLAFAGFVGLESCSAFSEEARSYGALSRAIVAAVVTVGVLYGIGTWALTVATGPGNIVAAANAEGTDLAFSLASQRVADGWVLAARLLYATSMFAGLLAWHNVANRYFFALGREGLLPARLASTSRAGAPRTASLTQSSLAGLVLAVFLIIGADPMTHLWYWGSTTGALGILTLLIGTAASVLAYFARRPASRRPHMATLITSALAVLGLGTVLVTTLVQFDVLTGTTSHAAWVLPSILGLAALAAAGWALVLRHRRPWVWRRLGYGTSAGLTEEDSQEPEQEPARDQHPSPVAMGPIVSGRVAAGDDARGGAGGLDAHVPRAESARGLGRDRPERAGESGRDPRGSAAAGHPAEHTGDARSAHPVNPPRTASSERTQAVNERLTVHDARATMLARAFYHDPIISWVIPEDSHRVDVYATCLDLLIAATEARGHGRCCIPSGGPHPHRRPVMTTPGRIAHRRGG